MPPASVPQAAGMSRSDKCPYAHPPSPCSHDWHHEGAHLLLPVSAGDWKVKGARHHLLGCATQQRRGALTSWAHMPHIPATTAHAALLPFLPEQAGCCCAPDLAPIPVPDPP